MSESLRNPVLILTVLMLMLASPGTTALAGQPGTPALGPVPEDVDLVYFTGQAFSGYILLEWGTSLENTNLEAFRLRRATVDDPAQGTVVTNPPINAHPGQAWDYDFQDTYNLVPGTTYYYWLDERDSSGNWWLIEGYVVVPYCSRYDVNCSQAVDTTDISLVAGAWGCGVFDVCYDERLDLVPLPDPVITVQDAMVVAGRWNCGWADACYWE